MWSRLSKALGEFLVRALLSISVGIMILSFLLSGLDNKENLKKGCLWGHYLLCTAEENTARHAARNATRNGVLP